MAVEYQEIRTELEADGFRLDDEEYTEAVNYARRKSKIFRKRRKLYALSITGCNP